MKLRSRIVDEFAIERHFRTQFLAWQLGRDRIWSTELQQIERDNDETDNELRKDL